MKKHIFKRILSIPIILFVLSIMIFSLIMFLSPSERAAVFVSSPDTLQNVSMDDLIERYGLDEPFYIQYLNWIKGILSGNLGWSTSARMPISKALSMRIPATIELLLFGQFIIFFGGIFLGICSSRNQNKFIDYFIRIITTIGISIPEFVISLFLLIIFYVKYDIFPPGRLSMSSADIVYSSQFINYTGMNFIDSLMNGRLDIFVDGIRHIILPSIAYSIGGLAASTRLMRSSLIANFSKGYVDTAIMKGLPDKKIVNRHILRNAMLPCITFTGMQIPALLGGSVVVETIFNYPGMGMFIVTAAQGLDFPAIIASSLAISILIIVSNLFVDILYGLFNPAIRVE